MTGSIRVSFGYMSTQVDVDRLVDVIVEYFQEKAPVQRQLDPAVPEQLNLPIKEPLTVQEQLMKIKVAYFCV